MTPPPDKSLTHRALMLGALAEGESRVTNPLATGDCLSTQACLGSLGVTIQPVTGVSPRTLSVQGVGMHGLREPQGVLDAENSGTLARLLSGILAGRALYAVLTGDTSLRTRPMLRVVEPLRRMGARIEGREGGRLAPLSFLPGQGRLTGGTHVVEVASAQVKSALLLAGLRCDGGIKLRGLVRSRDHTERFLTFLGVRLSQGDDEIVLPQVTALPAFRAVIPGDPSSAGFFVAASLLSGRDLEVRDCGLNPTRLGMLRVLERMGARIETRPSGSTCGEPVGSITVRPGDLAATTIEPEEVPGLIDEIPLLALLACAAHGTTVVRGAGELRHKETDRIRGIADMVSAFGGTVEVLEDGLRIKGPQRLRAGVVDPAGDHRLAMAGAVASCGMEGGVTVRGAECATVSYPDFLADFRRLGGQTVVTEKSA